ncbi:hypothetical protein VC83_00001 [Pseudogymnoascus destructans]|uniref:Fungal N-terminal domain-containing protein n=1 Tax=Pseudogymnoascus destructans TaxID=655981 RepID=A0A177AMI4_9PEZI|nr:uncharacterized protein VC83_07742 [Pseudogymnoascus destructans]XP_024328514.1 uncharacterized protein VC83_00001 [Pseudogymnoascus destructans]OAF55787.1 hypothetical protein VC83_07742 [Pseudogymnoascus destructans]OAF63245.1 hypothetical protein VC83_00001 [Pseudogymnoascus destructans]
MKFQKLTALVGLLLPLTALAAPTIEDVTALADVVDARSEAQDNSPEALGLEACKTSVLDMAAALGLVGGDFTAAVDLVTTVVNALRENREASEEYFELLRQLYSLRIALLRVKALHTGDSQHRELVGLRQAAAQWNICLSTGGD